MSAIHGLCLGSKWLQLQLFWPGEDGGDGDNGGDGDGGNGGEDGDEKEDLDLDSDNNGPHGIKYLILCQCSINCSLFALGVARSIFWSSIIFGSMKLVKMLRVSTEVRHLIMDHNQDDRNVISGSSPSCFPESSNCFQI